MRDITDRLPDQTQAARFTWWVLDERDEPLTQQELVALTGYSRRTIQSATNALEEAGHIDVDDHRSDERSKVYRAVDPQP